MGLIPSLRDRSREGYWGTHDKNGSRPSFIASSLSQRGHHCGPPSVCHFEIAGLEPPPPPPPALSPLSAAMESTEEIPGTNPNVARDLPIQVVDPEGEKLANVHYKIYVHPTMLGVSLVERP